MSFFSRPRPALARNAGEELWRLGDAEIYPVGALEHVVARRGTTPRMLPAWAVEFALGCTRFRPLEAHLADQADAQGWDRLQLASMRELLPALCEAGLLLSTSEVHERCLGGQDAEGTPAVLESIGFPTGGERGALLERAVRSFAANGRTFGRRVPLVVADNSANPRHEDECRERVKAWSGEEQVPMRFLGRDEKRRLKEHLLRAGACSSDVAEFALGDPHGLGFACGANRNALLLAHAGRPFCAVDDDVACRLAAPRDASTVRLGGFSQCDPFVRHLYPARAVSIDEARWVEAGFLGENERLLGRTLKSLTEAAGPGECDFMQVGSDFLRRTALGTARVRASFSGHVGDPGIPTSLYYLYYEGENRRRLWEVAEHYSAVFRSRSVSTMVPHPAVGDASVSPGMAVGLDARVLLPPMFPVLHAEDYVWGATLWQCRGEALLGHIPFAVLHDPGAGKPVLTPDDLGSTRPAVIMEWAHLLRRLVLKFHPAESLESTSRMRGLGRKLSEWGALASADWRELIATETLRHESEKLAWLEQQLEAADDAPDCWREDIERHLRQVREALTVEGFDIPYDLQKRGTPKEVRVLMQVLTGNFGGLLEAWPEMWEAAKGWS